MKKIQKTKDPKLLGPKLFDKKPNVENFVEYLMEKKPLDDIKEKKIIKKTVEIQRNKRFFLHNLLTSILVPGKGHYCFIILTFLFLVSLYLPSSSHYSMLKIFWTLC